MMKLLSECETTKDALAFLEQNSYRGAWLRGEEDQRSAKERVLYEFVQSRLTVLETLSAQLSELDQKRAELDTKMRRGTEELDAILQMAKVSAH